MEARFHQLVERWREKSKFLSSDSEIAMLPEYQSIIGMGPAVLPLVFRELAAEPDQWFCALAAITGENPVPPSSRGRIEEMQQAWIDWGRTHGHL